MNGQRNPRARWVIPLVGVLVLAALPAQAAEPAQAEPVAAVALHGWSASFAPRISFEELTLTVAGRGYASSQVVRGGQTVSWEAVDSEGYQLPDGTYNWEITVSPRLVDLDPRAFSFGTISADGRTMEAARAPRGQRQSGVFTIKNGVMVDPTLVEPEPARAAGAPGQLGGPVSARPAAEGPERIDMDGQ